MTSKTEEAWTHYWRSGNLATCFVGPGQRQDFNLRDFWTDFFRGFGDKTVLLDLCTGNGAIALLAAETALAGGKTCHVHGVDTAKIVPHKSVRNAPGALRRVRFWPGVNVEEMPFEDGVFDGISGQYALEYTDRVRSIPEVARVLGEGGRLRLLVHTAESDVVRASRATLEELRVMFETLRIFRTAQAAFKRLFPAEGGPAEPGDLAKKHLAVVTDFEERLRRLGAEAERGSSAGAMKFTADRLEALYAGYRRYRRHDALQFISALEEEMRFYRIRMKSICQAALEKAEVTEIAAAFAGHGLEMDTPTAVTVPPGDRHVGWQIAGRRTA